MSSSTINVPATGQVTKPPIPWGLWARQIRAILRLEIEKNFLGRRSILLAGRQVGDRQRILLTFEDITDRLTIQAAVRISELRYRRLFEAAKDGIIILDPHSRKITDINPFMSDLLGYAHAELLESLNVKTCSKQIKFLCVCKTGLRRSLAR